ncbi:hypothetical protein BDV25DRAFT_50299 [Aspergillus avenaceus]|uniref:Uncharacterized protein n=1 Tax=Aspergillus avenaceus TaxID=36643 RepID=A0A5N6U2Y7_ASPAV|nr:hypothetical protein BDV25DRAFT_50299 [Aspergillus avenaceus]
MTRSLFILQHFFSCDHRSRGAGPQRAFAWCGCSWSMTFVLLHTLVLLYIGCLAFYRTQLHGYSDDSIGVRLVRVRATGEGNAPLPYNHNVRSRADRLLDDAQMVYVYFSS